jgi:hypothetical protein
VIGWLLRRCPPAVDPAELAERIEQAVVLSEGALIGTHGLRKVWTDADYLTAILAVLSGDGDRARRAAYAAYARTPIENDPPIFTREETP